MAMGTQMVLQARKIKLNNRSKLYKIRQNY